MPNGRCRLHGGKSLKGAAHPAFKHGRRSKSVPAQLTETYHRSLGDPELLNLSSEIALTDAMIDDILANQDLSVPSVQFQLTNLIDQRRKLVESEQKRRVAMKTMMTPESAMALVAALLDAVKRNVSDRATLAAIGTEFDRLIAGSAD